MKLSKKVLKHRATQAIICWLLAQYIRLVYYTSCRTKDFSAVPEEYATGEKNAIFTFWHGRLLLQAMLCPPKRPMFVLISQHGDGGLITRVMQHFNILAVRGSSSRGSVAALKNVLQKLEEGANISITPDGPRGPVHQVQPGAIMAAKHAGLPIIAVSFSARRYKEASSWDKFLFAWPFNRLAFVAEAPLDVPEDADKQTMQALAEELASRLQAAGSKADSLVKEA